MSRDQWAAVDQELFSTLRELRELAPEDPLYRTCKDRFGRLFVKKLGGWLAVRFGRELRAQGLEAEEVLHEVYLRVHRRIFAAGGLDQARFESPRKLKNYLFTIAHKTAVTVLASRSGRAVPNSDFSRAGEATPALAWIWKYLPFLDPDRRSARPATFEGTEFKEVEQKALYLWYVDRSPHRIIAEQLRTTTNGAKQLVYRAKMRLLALMPRCAAQECLALLAAMVPDHLSRQPAGHPGDASRRTGAGTLEAFCPLARILLLGIEQDRALSFRTHTGRILQGKIEEALADPGGAAQPAGRKAPPLGPLRELLTDALLYVTLATLRKVPRKWPADGIEDVGGREQLDPVDLLTLLFFCLCAALPDRPTLRPGLAGPARRALAAAWPVPPVPSPDWYGQAAEAEA